MSSKTRDASLRTSTIPYTPTSTGWHSVHPRPLRPIGLHPRLDATQTPALPGPRRPSVFHTTEHGIYQLSTHLVPAAYPRLTPDFPLPAMPTYVPGGTFGERRIKTDALAKEVQETQDMWADGKIGGKPSEKLLWACVNRYVRTSGRSVTPAGSRITLFLAHANGLHKEASGCFGDVLVARGLIAPGRRGRRCFDTCLMRLRARWSTRYGHGTPSSMEMRLS